MRSIWKSLTVGTLTGVSVGVALDRRLHAGHRTTEFDAATRRAIRDAGPRMTDRLAEPIPPCPPPTSRTGDC
jgi:hypothetical protein